MRKKKTPVAPVPLMKAFKTRTPYSRTITAIERKMEAIKFDASSQRLSNEFSPLFRQRG